MGGPATAGKRWPHFFQMGKLRHKEVFFFGNLPKVTHSESAFQGERGSSHSKKHGLPHLESKRQKRSRTARGGHHPL